LFRVLNRLLFKKGETGWIFLGKEDPSALAKFTTWHNLNFWTNVEGMRYMGLWFKWPTAWATKTMQKLCERKTRKGVKLFNTVINFPPAKSGQLKGLKGGGGERKGGAAAELPKLLAATI